MSKCNQIEYPKFSKHSLFDTQKSLYIVTESHSMVKLHIVLLLLLKTGSLWSRAGPQISLGQGPGSARSLYDQIVRKINQVRKSSQEVRPVFLGPFSPKESATTRWCSPASTTGAVSGNTVNLFQLI